MAREALEAPQAVARFLTLNAQAIAKLGSRLSFNPPSVVLTSARGSSDHAATYFKYLTEIMLGVPCASVGASVVSVYGAKLWVKDALALTISQSGQSPDIVAFQEAAKAAGAYTVAIVNAENSPVARSADLCLYLHAGTESSVAATKTCTASFAAAAAIVSAWKGDEDLSRGLAVLSEDLVRASQETWPTLVKKARTVHSLFVLGRGVSLPLAFEVALKFKETCGIHAEAYSLAEVMHGPVEILGDGFPVLAFSQTDATRTTTQQALAQLRAAGADVLFAGTGGLPVAPVRHPFLEPIAMLQSAYLAIEEIARSRGRDPDRPRLLQKATATV